MDANETLVRPYTLFAHQRETIEKALKSDHLALFLEQGLGKTLCALEIVRRLEKWPVLVVCPATVVGVWLEEIAWALPDWKAIPLIGTRQKRLKLLNEYLGNKQTIFVINYEGIRIWTRRAAWYDSYGRKRWRWANDLAEKPPWQIAILDESSKIKRFTTKQSRACHALSKVPYRYILSGTPITKDPLDLWSQYRFLCPDEFGYSYKSFEAKYAIKRRIYVKGQREVAIVVGIRNSKELLGRAAKHAIRRHKAECLDLPPKIHQSEKVKLAGQQAKAYKDLARQMVAHVGNDVVSVVGILPKILRLQEIVQGFTTTDEGEKIIFHENPKQKALADLLERIMPEHKAVIWYRFRAEEKIILKAAQGLTIASINGSIPIDERRLIIKRFQNGEMNLLLCQYQTGAYGITLTRADYCIFFSQSWDLELRWQASDRLHRIGQDKCVIEVDIVAENTIDQAIAEACRRKQQWANQFDRATLQKLTQGRGI